MDIHKALELSKVADEQVEIAKQYEKARKKSGLAKTQLDLILTSKLRELRSDKKNLGVEMAILMLMEEDAVARDLYKEYMDEEAKYKGLERILDAYASKLITEQAIMKYQGRGETWG